jgi:uncharacterized membrane protein YkvA (DUF1232 family)
MGSPRHRPHTLAERISALKIETLALYRACRDPRTSWYAKALGAVVVGYALSPIDLIPDFIPLIGYLDDLLIIPLGIMLVRRMIPPAVMGDARARARNELAPGSTHRLAAAVVIAIWVIVPVLVVFLVVRAVRG